MIALNKQLDYLEPLATSADGPPSTEDQDIDTYQCGDFETLVKTESILPLPSLANMSNLTVQESDAILEMNEYLEKQLIFRRNRKMTRYIQSLLHNPSRNETSFFAIGAGKILRHKIICTSWIGISPLLSVLVSVSLLSVLVSVSLLSVLVSVHYYQYWYQSLLSVLVSVIIISIGISHYYQYWYQSLLSVLVSVSLLSVLVSVSLLSVLVSVSLLSAFVLVTVLLIKYN